MKSDQRGFGLIGILVLMPFMISLIALMAGSAMLLKADARLKHECRTSLLNSQREVASDLKELMRLNTRAKLLRRQRAAAEAEVKAARLVPNPVVLAAAQAHLAVVKSFQAALAIQQNALVLKAKAKSFAAPMKAKSAVFAGLSAESKDNGVRLPSTTSQTRAAWFDVVKEPANDPTPDYKPSPKFTAKQTADLNVDLELAPLLPSWLRALLPTGGLKLNTHCQATIERQEDEWIETLSADK